MTKLRTLAWNAHAGSPSEGQRVLTWLGRWAHQYRVQRIVLNEVGGIRPHLAAWAAENGYRIHQERRIAWRPGAPKPEQGSTAVLIKVKGRDAVKVNRLWTAVLTLTWLVVSTGTRKAPRRQVRAALRVDGRRIRTSGEHWPTGEGTGPNTAAWTQARDRAFRFLARKSPALVDGDLNATRQQATDLARQVGGHHAGRIVDWCVTNSGTVTMTSLHQGGSDHVAVIYDVEF